MDALAILNTVIGVIQVIQQVAPVAYQAIQDIQGFAAALYEKIKGGTLTADERIALEAKIAELHNEFQSALPAD